MKNNQFGHGSSEATQIVKRSWLTTGKKEGGEHSGDEMTTFTIFYTFFII